MSKQLIANLERRLDRMRRLAAISHDPRVVELVLQTAQEIEADLAVLREEQAPLTQSSNSGPSEA